MGANRIERVSTTMGPKRFWFSFEFYTDTWRRFNAMQKIRSGECLPQKMCLKFIYSEKATKFREISTLLLSCVVPVKSKVEISQNIVAFSEYMNLSCMHLPKRFYKMISKIWQPSSKNFKWTQVQSKNNLTALTFLAKICVASSTLCSKSEVILRSSLYSLSIQITR